jgi:tetratricopeptide (TPR) repeat protein
MILHKTKLMPSFQVESFQIFLRRFRWLFLIGLALAAAGINLWAWYHYQQAQRLQERYRFSQAYSHYVRAAQVWRWSASLHLYAAQTARRAGLYAEAERHLAECQRLQGAAAEASLPLALERLLLQAQSGDIATIEEPLWQYIEKNKPETPLILEALARGYARGLRLSAAQGCLRRILEREPENVEALVLAGKITEQGGGDTEEALQYYRRALELDAERDDARLSLAQILLRDRPEEARAHFQYLIARQPDNTAVMLGLGQAQRMLNETDKARALLEAVLAKEPENSKALAELGKIALLAGKMAEAETFFRQAITADPANYDANYRLSQCLTQNPDREREAAEQIAVCKRLEADLTRLGAIASREMSRTPNDPNLYYEVGAFYLRYGKPDVGVRWLYRALKLDPAHQPSHQALYEYFQRIGEREKAEQHRLQLP